jgi:type I restriction enzyme S subunit
LPQYLTAILNLYQRQRIFYRICTNWNNQSGVNATLLGSVKIPIPSMNKQLEIVEHIQTIQKQARRLRREAKDMLVKAKAQVEQMILGEETRP